MLMTAHSTVLGQVFEPVYKSQLIYSFWNTQGWRDYRPQILRARYIWKHLSYSPPPSTYITSSVVTLQNEGPETKQS